MSLAGAASYWCNINYLHHHWALLAPSISSLELERSTSKLVILRPPSRHHSHFPCRTTAFAVHSAYIASQFGSSYASFAPSILDFYDIRSYHSNLSAFHHHYERESRSWAWSPCCRFSVLPKLPRYLFFRRLGEIFHILDKVQVKQHIERASIANGAMMRLRL